MTIASSTTGTQVASARICPNPQDPSDSCTPPPFTLAISALSVKRLPRAVHIKMKKKIELKILHGTRKNNQPSTGTLSAGLLVHFPTRYVKPASIAVTAG